MLEARRRRLPYKNENQSRAKRNETSRRSDSGMPDVNGCAAKLTNKEIAAELLLPPVKLHCSMLAEEAVKQSRTCNPSD